jgi:predicted phage terminase large subunit-like protein
MLEINSGVSPKTLKKLQEKKQAVLPDSISLTSESFFRYAPPVLLPYQQRFLSEFSRGEYTTYVFEKSRRIGITWAVAAYAVLEASKKTGGDVIYISTSLDLAKEFLLSVAFWARALAIACDALQENLFDSERDDIQTLKITFKSGYRVLALPSKPEAVRGRKASICILDEFAFIENAQEFITAVAPLSIWGTRFIYISTHNGIDNQFNLICNDIKSGKLPYHLSKCTFRQAVDEGLFHRVCLATGKKWSDESELAWIKKCYAECLDSAQELDVIPSETSHNAIFKKSDFQILVDRELPEYFEYKVLAFDTAATEKTTSCYTVGIVLGKLENNFYILDFQYNKSDALQTQEFIVRTIKTQNKDVTIFLELEGGSQSILWFQNSLKPALPGYRIQSVKPEGSKLIRAIPIAEKVKDHRVFLLRRSWNDAFLDAISKFDGTPGIPLITDTGDALSLAFSEINKGLKGLHLGGVVVGKNNKRITF